MFSSSPVVFLPFSLFFMKRFPRPLHYSLLISAYPGLLNHGGLSPIPRAPVGAFLSAPERQGCASLLPRAGIEGRTNSGSRSGRCEWRNGVKFGASTSQSGESCGPVFQCLCSPEEVRFVGAPCGGAEMRDTQPGICSQARECADRAALSS